MTQHTEQQDECYDIIIVGAGVAGLMLAHLLDDSGRRVLLLEQKSHIHIEPATFGTFTCTVKERGLSDYIDHYFDTFTFYGPTHKASATEKEKMCLVNYQNWAQDLKLKNVTVRTNSRLQAARRVSDGIILTAGNRSYLGAMVVDSSGYAQAAATLLGYKTSTETGLSFEIELTGCKFPHTSEASFILNNTASNSGGWLYIFPNGKGQYGWADFYPESEANVQDLKKRTLRAMQRLAPHNEWIKDATIDYSYGRFGPTGHVRHLVEDNLIAIGDAGKCATPLTLEGFRQAIDSAAFAAQTIKQAKNYRQTELRIFLRLFNGKYGRYYRIHHWVRYIYLRWMANDDIDRWIKNFSKMSRDDIFRLIMGELTAGLMLRTLDPGLVLSIAMNAINNLLPARLRFRPLITPSKKEVLNAKG